MTGRYGVYNEATVMRLLECYGPERTFIIVKGDAADTNADLEAWRKLDKALDPRDVRFALGRDLMDQGMDVEHAALIAEVDVAALRSSWNQRNRNDAR